MPRVGGSLRVHWPFTAITLRLHFQRRLLNPSGIQPSHGPISSEGSSQPTLAG